MNRLVKCPQCGTPVLLDETMGEFPCDERIERAIAETGLPDECEDN